jgi:hypothetical protein
MSSVKPPKVFVSATSDDLTSVRTVVKEALLKIGCMPIEQADFPPDYRTVAEFLKNQIQACDAVVHIVGKRYGAEPNPDSLPPGTTRRSYTQLEYDVAKRLGKKVFTFICGDDFPYGAYEPEPEVKVLLQGAHRAALVAGNDKYELILTGHQCAERIKHLRLQLEELAKQLATEQRRQRVAWTIVAGALVALLVVSIGTWIAVGGMRQNTSDILKNTNELKNTTNNIEKTGGEIKKKIDESSQVQRATAAKVESIDTSVHSLIESNLLGTIAQKAEIDPLQVKQLVLQAKSAEVDTLAYARQLSSEGRHDDAYGLARFVAETALLPENANYRAAAEAFLIAAEECGKVASVPDTVETALAKYTEVEKIASRGQDAWRTLRPEEQAASELLFTDLALARNFALSQMMGFGEPHHANATLDKAIAQVDEALSRNISDKSKLAKLRRRRALCLAHKSRWVSIANASKLAADALIEADRAVALADELGTVSDRTLALNSRSHVRMLTYDLQSETAARTTLKNVQNDSQAALSLPMDDSVADQRCELTAHLGRATLELGQRALTSQEQEKNFTDAIKLLDAAIRESKTHKHTYVGRVAAMGQLRAYCLKNRGRHDGQSMQEVDQAFEAAGPYGFNVDEDKLILADFTIAFASMQLPNEKDPSGLKVAADTLQQTLVRYPAAVAPKLFAKTSMALARVWLARSKIDRFTLQDGLPEQDFRQGIDVLERLLLEFSAESAPRVWAEANLELGRAISESNSVDHDSSTAALNNALTILTRQEDPQLWADANRQLGVELIKSRPAQLDKGMAAFRNAFLVYTEKAFPDRFQEQCYAIARTYVEAAMSSSEDSARQQLHLLAIKFAVAGSESGRAFGTNGVSNSYRLEELVAEIKAALSTDEQKQIDNEIERLKKEFAQNGIDPLK